MLKNSFFHRIVDSWNTLPCETRYASSVDIFKSKVVNFLMKMLIAFIYYIYIYFLVSLAIQLYIN